MVKKVFYSLGSLAAILLLSGVLSILEYRRMSDYVSELIAANIKSINLAQKLSDITEEYNHQMLAVVVQNDISLMPEFDLADFMAQSDSLKNSFTSIKALPMVDSVEVSFDAFMKTSLKFDEVFLADLSSTLLFGGDEVLQPENIVAVLKGFLGLGVQAHGIAAELLPQHMADGVVLQTVAVVGVVHNGHDAEFHGFPC